MYWVMLHWNDKCKKGKCILNFSSSQLWLYERMSTRSCSSLDGPFDQMSMCSGAAMSRCSTAHRINRIQHYLENPVVTVHVSTGRISI